MEINNETKILVGVLLATIIIIVIGAVLSGGTGDQGQVATEPIANTDRLLAAESHFTGPADAPVTVIEFGDFECPACGALHPILQHVKENNSEVKFVYRHFPLTSIHPRARPAALAAEAAAAQGKFFEYHDQLYENQSQLGDQDFITHAEAIGLDVAAFEQALADGVGEDAVQQDVSDSAALGLRSTPTLFVNGVQYTGQYSVNGLQAAIDAAHEATPHEHTEESEHEEEHGDNDHADEDEQAHEE